MQKEKPEGCREGKEKKEREMKDKRKAWRNSCSSDSSSQLCPVLAIIGHWWRGEQTKEEKKKREERAREWEKSGRNKKTLGRMHVY